MACYDCARLGTSRSQASPSSPTCSEAHVHKVIKDDGHLALTEGVQHRFAPQVLVPGVGGVDGHGCVSQHGLDTGGRYDHLLVCQRQRETGEDYWASRGNPGGRGGGGGTSLTWSVHLVSKRYQDSKLHFVFVARHWKQSPAAQLLLIHLQSIRSFHQEPAGEAPGKPPARAIPPFSHSTSHYVGLQPPSLTQSVTKDANPNASTPEQTLMTCFFFLTLFFECLSWRCYTHSRHLTSCYYSDAWAYRIPKIGIWIDTRK